MRKHLVALPLLIVLPLAACGSDKKESTPTTASSAASTTVAAAGAGDTTVATAGTTGDTTFDTVGTSPTAPTAGLEKFCAINTQIDQAFSEFTTAQDEASWSKIIDLVDQIAGESPATLQPDIKTAQGFYADLEQQLREANWDISAINETSLPPEAEAASQRIQDFVTANCPQA